MYNCAIGVASKTDDRKLDLLKKWNQIPDNLLGGLRLPLNTFARELLTNLGLGICQFNSNAWRLVISMQVLWREVFEGDRPLAMDKFLYCYKPSEINQSLGFYQFTTRGKDYRLIKSLVTSDRN